MELKFNLQFLFFVPGLELSFHTDRSDIGPIGTTVKFNTYPNLCNSVKLYRIVT